MIISLSGRMGSGKDTVGKIIQNLTTPKPTRLKENEFGNSYREPDGSWAVHEEKSPFVIKKWATALRKVSAILLGMDEQFLYTDEFKAMTLPDCWWYYQFIEAGGNNKKTISIQEWKLLNDNQKQWWSLHQMTGRDFLQKLGTDAIRNGLHENTWVNALMSEYDLKNIIGKEGNIVINKTDTWREIPKNWIITDTRFPNELAAVKERGALTIRVERNNGTRAIDINPHPSETALDNSDFDYTIENDGTIEDLVNMVKLILQKEKIIL